jgi:hypothetical protein
MEVELNFVLEVIGKIDSLKASGMMVSIKLGQNNYSD